MSDLKHHSELPAADTWRLEDLVESPEAWERQFSALKERLPRLTAFRGTLSDEQALAAYFKEDHDFNLSAERLFVYAKMSRDTDNENDEAVARCDRILAFLAQAEAETAFVTPELSAIPDETLLALADKPAFADRDRYLRALVREKAHLLGEEGETVLALSGEIASSYDTIFTMLDDVDLSFAPVKGPDGKTLEMSHGRYSLYLQDRCRETRRQAYESMYEAHRAHINTLAALYTSSVKKDIFYARARRFSSVLEGELYGPNIPVAVYDNLTAAVHAGLPTLHRYVALRKKLLGLEDMKMYDMYVPVVSTDDEVFTFEEAQSLAKEALAPLGEDYRALLDRAFTERWIDVYETKGKTSGAYSWGAYGVHPYMLLNFQGQLNDVFTLVHEAGHSMHTFFSDRALPYEKAQYRIFVAEVASTVNEVLLLKHLLKTTKDQARKAYLLNHLLEQFRTTVFRQTMFAEFERLVHEKAEAGESLPVGELNRLYGELNRQYYSDAVETDGYISTEWSRIPHFYNAYYVYQYATGFASAVAIADRILSGDETAVTDYKRFLSSGGSDDPVELLKIAGVDLSKTETLENAMRVFEDTLNEFERTVQA